MKLKYLISLCCCAAVAAFSCLSVSAAPEDSSYIDDIYNWISSTASDLWDEYNSSDSADSSDSSDYYEEPTESYDDTSSEYYEEPTYDYYEEATEPYYEYEQTEPETEYVQANEDTSSEESNWYDWFAISQPETEPVTDPVIEDTADETDSASTFEYVGYGFLMWAVIIVGGIMTLAILTNTHIRKKS